MRSDEVAREVALGGMSPNDLALLGSSQLMLGARPLASVRPHELAAMPSVMRAAVVRVRAAEQRYGLRLALARRRVRRSPCVVRRSPIRAARPRGRHSRSRRQARAPDRPSRGGDEDPVAGRRCDGFVAQKRSATLRARPLQVANG